MKTDINDLPDTASITMTVKEFNNYVENKISKLLESAELYTYVYSVYPARVMLGVEGKSVSPRVNRSLFDLIVEGAERGLDANTALRLKKVMYEYIQWFPEEAKSFLKENNRDTTQKGYISLNDPVWEKVRDWQPQAKD